MNFPAWTFSTRHPRDGSRPARTSNPSRPFSPSHVHTFPPPHTVRRFSSSVFSPASRSRSIHRADRIDRNRRGSFCHGDAEAAENDGEGLLGFFLSQIKKLLCVVFSVLSVSPWLRIPFSPCLCIRCIGGRGHPPAQSIMTVPSGEWPPKTPRLASLRPAQAGEGNDLPPETPVRTPETPEKFFVF